MTFGNSYNLNDKVFQLTSSRRGWLEIKKTESGCTYISTHILTKRMTYRHLLLTRNEWHFNSHPHEEDDRIGDEIQHFERISTHILTKRMTFTGEVRNQLADISTHILTKRMTIFEVLTISVDTIFQLTSSRRGWPLPFTTRRLSLSFQLTSSRRGWQQF